MALAVVYYHSTKLEVEEEGGGQHILKFVR